MRKSIRLIAGLGNPGRDYAETRHNVGFMLVEALAAKTRVSWALRREFEAESARFEHSGNIIHLLKPLTYMNESGKAVAGFARYHRLESEEVAIVCDEINLPFGRAKLSDSGSAGGHNGLTSVMEHLGSDFVRFRLGVGPRQPPEIDLKDYVLGKITPDQIEVFLQKIPEFLEGLDLLLRQGLEPAMNRVNRRSINNDRNSHQESL